MPPLFSSALSELRQRFAEQLPERLASIRSEFRLLDPVAWNADVLDSLHRQVHGLTGAAGTFGMSGVSRAARRLELELQALVKQERLPDAAALARAGQELEQLEQAALAGVLEDYIAPGPSLKLQVSSGPPLVYLVEDDWLQAQSLSKVLMEAGYQVEIFTDLSRFRALLEAESAVTPSAIIMDMIFPEGESAGAEMIAELRLSVFAHVPVVVASVRDDLPARLAALRAGARRYMAKPLDTERFVAILDELTASTPAEPYRVVLLDDDALLLEAQTSVLQAAGMEVMALSDPLELFGALGDFQPDVLILDVYMPGVTGPELAAILRDRDAFVHLPVLFLSAETDMTQQLQALSLGGDDFLVKPVQPDHLVAAVRARAKRSRQSKVIRGRLETALYEREREHQALNHHAIVSVSDRAGNITYVNEKFCQISGYSMRELLGRNHRVLRSDRHEPEFYREMWQTIASGQIWRGEICNRRKDGSYYWVESTITPFLDAVGVPYQYVSIRTDITGIKQSGEMQRLISRVAANLLDAEQDDMDRVIDDVLQQSARLIQADRAYLFQFSADGRSMSNTHEWCAPGVELLASEAQNLPLNLFPWWQKQMTRDGRVIVLDVPAMPDEAAAERLVFVNREVQALLTFALRREGKIYGFIGYEAVRNRREWKPEVVDLLGVLVDGVSSALNRRQVEEVSAAMRERLRRGQQYANIGTWDWNIATGELYWTERIAPLFGYPEGELETSYENFLNAIHPEDRQKVTDAVSASIDSAVPYEVEHRVVWPDGTVRWLLERGAVIRDAGGKAIQMLGVVQDIDDRKRAEVQLAEREKELRDAQTLAHIGNWTADMVNGTLEWSDEIFRIFGYEPGQIRPSVDLFLSAVHPDDRERVLESELNAQKTGRHDVVHRIVRPDGAIRHVHERAWSKFDESGELIALTGTVQDLTELVEAQNRLLETEERFVFAVEGAGDGVWDWNLQTGEMQFSSLYMAMLGYAENELPSRVETWKNSVHPDDLPAVQGALESYLAGHAPQYQVELRLRCKDGGYKWILCRGTVVGRDKAGKALRMIGIHSDINTRKLSEQALMVAREEAERANQAKSEFLSSMSHELRTPMNGILGFAQLLEFDDALSNEQQDNVQEILKAGRHLLELINEVLDLAKVESGHIDLSLEAVDVCSIVEEGLSLIKPLADRNHISLSHAGLAGAVVRADRTRLKQVMLNLLSNAVKYNRAGGSVRVEIKADGEDWLQLRVLDSGAGIAPELLPRLFEPFNRLGAESSEIEGTGIGLTITRRIVELMGGRVGVESEVGVGSIFWIDLPMEVLPAATASAEAEQDTLNGEVAVAEQTVLYIEDNPANLKLVAQLLARRRHLRLLTAHASTLGIELARTNRPDLILLDVNMPGLDGYQVLQVLKADAATQPIPVIALTANAMPRDIERGMKAGFTGYLTKPIDLGEFFSTIDNILAKPEQAN